MKLKVAAVQMRTFPGDVKRNLDICENYIKEAVENDVKMIFFPELNTYGYVPNKKLWNYYISNKIDINTWLKETSQEYSIHIGMGLIEYINCNFRNTYLISNPSGEIEGRGEKSHSESYIFKMGDGKHIIDTEYGKMGICICADNHFTDVIENIKKECVDVLIMPHACPTPFKTNNNITIEDIENQRKELNELPMNLSNILDVPTIFINQIGSFEPMDGIFGKLMDPEYFQMEGFSKIVDKGKVIIGEAADQEGILIGEIEIKAKSNLIVNEIPNYQGWIHPGSKIVRKIIGPIDVLCGQFVYRRNLRKYQKEISK